MNVTIMVTRSPSLEVSCGVHNHQTELGEKWLINHVYSVKYSHMIIYIYI